MVWKAGKTRREILESEIGTVKKHYGGQIRVALVYPNIYHVGMSNLGFHAVYRLLSAMDNVLCERAFLPDSGDSKNETVTTVESGANIRDFDIIAFSISFENDCPNILNILGKVRLPLRSGERQPPHPLVIAGGVVSFLNPEPIAPFIDCFLIGEGEELLNRFFDLYDPDEDRERNLEKLAVHVPGVYVPAFYETGYNEDGTVSSFKPLLDVPERIKRVCASDLSQFSTDSAIVTPHTSFERTYLIEVGRGCHHGCRFCAAGYVYRPPRFRPASAILHSMEEGAAITDKIGLVGAAVSDHPEIKQFCRRFESEPVHVSMSSMRADALSTELIESIIKGGVKTATIAPDAGSERMRRVINKGLKENEILDATENLILNGMLNIKLYFMVGLPTETMEDAEAIIDLCKKIKHRFLKSSRPKKRIGEITVSVHSFVPKPHTPFQWSPMEDVRVLKEKIKRIKRSLNKVANVKVHADVPKWAYIQALLSRGDRRTANILEIAHKNRENWAKTFNETPVNADFYIHRERKADEIFPWDFIDHGIKKSFLRNEYEKAIRGETSPPCPMKSCSICGVCE